MNLKMIFSYKGSNYYGYAKQPNKITIQGIIEENLNKIFQEKITIFASGRTDKWVHAINQVANFHINKDIETNSLTYKLNKLLPNDIYIKNIEVVDEEFNSRLSAKSKTYLYLINSKYSPFFEDLSLNYEFNNLELVEKGMKLFSGKHNFKNFTGKKLDALNFIREIFFFNLEKKDDFYLFKINGNGFMTYMVRKIIATLIELDKGNISIEFIKDSLNKENRDIVTYTASPKGLYLYDVLY
ncbi:MAG: tRNA pseudouridine(38-40) synthase TruA [Firmicutes bacterium]|uniref:tRNA pseudouridine synthase A n=1 Tax=Candidatus Onthovivens merdipullorum TaxID=2840889 RepID=A0A9D9DHJ2_9BACL|nr:tRNA pseudouridine(38-40) synthase TruA [Candidatus Onthovivens merdipullorum]